MGKYASVLLVVASLFSPLPAALATSMSTASTPPTTLSSAAPNVEFTSDREVVLFSHNVTSTLRHGVVNHVWSTACGGRGIDYKSLGGVSIYRFYVDGETEASVEVSAREFAMMSFDPLTPGAAAVPWGTDLFGQTSDMDGFFSNLAIPFVESIRVTAQLPPGVQPFNVYSIIRGVEMDREAAPAVSVGGVGLPVGTKARLVRSQHPALPSLAFAPIVNLTSGAGVIFAHGLAMSSSIVGSNSLHYLEGCFHLFTPWAPLDSPAFPGVVLSTGMEDMYDSSFYFHAGKFQLPVSGVTHLCVAQGDTQPHPVCADNSTSQFSAYRVQTDTPLWFAGGVQFVVRNGDTSNSTPWGQGKCYNRDTTGGAGVPTAFSSWTWVYMLPGAAQS